MDKPGRPLGLSLAIIISLALFSLLPLGQVIFVLSLRQQFQAIEFLEGGGAIGGGMGFPDSSLIFPTVSGLLFFGVAIAAWRGRPSSIRVIFMATVIFITLVTIVLTVVALGTPPSLEQGIDSSAEMVDALMSARVWVSVLVALYVLWYVNRGPARAFYRGYYLPDPVEETATPS